ncbi:MAG: 4-hydroxy-tetrahydrodipicolinate synthase [Desulfobacterales bacterium]|jgi:4-hydroxy-tetrahydrodipicolinate synthase
MNKLKGTFTVMVTPFTEDEELDEKGFRKNIDWYIEEGIHGVICLGSTGEFANLSIEERRRVIDLTADQVRGRVPIIAGTAANSTRETIAMTKYAKDAGVDAALIVAPFYGLPTQDDLYGHYRAISENVSIPIMAYNNPGFSGVDMLPPLIEKLAAIDNVLYLKESTGDIKRVHELLQRCGDSIDIWCGWDDLVYEFFLLSCRGWVAPIANFMPGAAAELFTLVEEKAYDKAKALFFKMLPLLNHLEAGQLLAKVKAAMNMIGKAGGKPRRPFLPISEEQKNELRTMLSAVGLM